LTHIFFVSTEVTSLSIMDVSIHHSHYELLAAVKNVYQIYTLRENVNMNQILFKIWPSKNSKYTICAQSMSLG